MSKLNINKTEWLELVFEGKNKEYGAYQLRKEDGATTTKAFFSALAFLTAIILLPMLLSSFGEKPIVKPTKLDDPGLIIRQLTLPPKEQPKTQARSMPPKSQPPVTTETLTNVTIVDADVAPDTQFTKPEDVGTTTNNTNTNGSTNGTGTEATTTTNTTENNDDVGETILNTAMVEKNPAFPGGIGEFLRIVGSRFTVPEIEEEKTLKVLVYFVVERDGSLSNITVSRSPGFGLDKEAIRVLKSIKTKWEPGVYKGKPVRTSYSLPIVVKTN